jgi:Cd2+/Zn2+-exporting ATPase
MGAAGSDVAMNSASVALMSNDLRRLPFLVGLSRATTRVIWQNLAFGVAFILVGGTASVLGKLHPMLAAALHTFASAVVVFNSARMVRYGEHIESHVPQPRDVQASPVPGRVALQPV